MAARQATARAERARRPAEEEEPKTPAAVLDAPNPDQALVQTNGAQILEFIRNIARFFSMARELEMAAQAKLTTARALKAPTTADEDEQIQRFIRDGNLDRKKLVEHWSITTVFHQVHRNLTAARGRGEKFLEDACAIAQRLHNDYTEAERRRAAAETEARRRAQETLAQQEREAEAARIEAEAVAREAASSTLSEREEIFTVDVARGVAPYDAAVRAGFAQPRSQSEKLLKTPKIQAAIQALADAAALRQQAQARREQPLDVRVDEARPEITRATGAVDRTTHSAEIVDEARLIAAAIQGGYGIPHDILQVKPAKVNEYARALQEHINLWPGVRHVKTTKTI